MEYYNVIPNTDTTFGEAMDAINQNFDLTHTALGDIEYATRKSKGLFSSENLLNDTIPEPIIGDWALVGDDFPAEIYICETDGVWSDSGKTYGGDSIIITEEILVTQSQYDAITNPDPNIKYVIYVNG